MKYGEGSRLMQLYQLEQFCMIARYEHISRAALELHVSQPTLSLNLARLEEELGMPLFDRVGRNIKLNDYGRVFYKHVEHALLELDAARQALKDISAAADTEARFADALFNDTYTVVQSFLQTRPSAKVIHLVLTIPDILSKLDAGQLDFGIIVAPKGHDFGNRFQWQPLWETELMALIKDTHPLAEREKLDLADLKDQEIICAINGFDTRDAFDYYCAQAGFTPNCRYTSIKPYLFNDLTRQYGWVSIMSKIMYDCHDIEREDVSGLRSEMTHICARPIVNPRCEVQFGIVTARSNYLSRSAKVLIDFVSQYFRENAGMF